MKSTVVTLGVIMTVFFGLLILLTRQADQSAFRYTAQEMHQLVTSTNYVIPSDQIKEMPEYVLIDIREPEEFILGHLDGAINIPVSSVLDEEFKSSFSSDIPKIILSYDPIRTHETWMLLTQLGYKNLWVMDPEKPS